ncbi:YIP1 family protein [Tabrizicola sp.]|uniref:YIP1 family protein n=1 Tax=Tabrizicola sp. TaxID=2005166 RepID=UPI00286B4A85|nr:YIP1 family protein [Tabrizicola sp.]
MAVTTDILATWARPRLTLRRKLADGVRDDRALAVLMGACALIFVAQLPALSRAAHFNPEVPLDARMGGALMATIFLLPPILYGVAAISHLVARLFGGKGSFFTARLALFWALLCVTPLMLLHGLVAGLIGSGIALTVVGVVVLAAFLTLWVLLLTEAER